MYSSIYFVMRLLAGYTFVCILVTISISGALCCCFLLATNREAAWQCFSDICLSVCNTITFKSLDVESLFLVCGYNFSKCGSSLHTNVIPVGKNRGHNSKKNVKFSIPVMLNFTGNNSGGSVKIEP